VPRHKTAAWKAPRQHQHYPYISRISYYLSLLPVPLSAYSYISLMYIFHLISIDLQLSCSSNPPTLQSLQVIKYIVTDYRYWPSHKTAAWKAPRQCQRYPRISRISYYLSLLPVLNLMYILHLISIDLQSSCSLNSPTLQSLHIYILALLYKVRGLTKKKAPHRLSVLGDSTKTSPDIIPKASCLPLLTGQFRIRTLSIQAGSRSSLCT